MNAAELLKSADTAAALKALSDEVRSKPADAKLRVFMAQLMCVTGQWERALNQLTVAAELDALAIPMKQMYGEAIRCDVRPMAGVEPGFDTAVQDGRVREDLLRRLSVIGIDVPPLRNRREDIPALANYFVRQVCASLGAPPKTLSRPALSLISALPWRGNAVELRGLIESVAVGLPGGRGISLDDVLAHVKLDGGPAVLSQGGSLKEAREHDGLLGT